VNADDDVAQQSGGGDAEDRTPHPCRYVIKEKEFSWNVFERNAIHEKRTGKNCNEISNAVSYLRRESYQGYSGDIVLISGLLWSMIWYYVPGITLYAKSAHDNIPAHIVRAMKERF